MGKNPHHVDRAGRADSTRFHRHTPAPSSAESWPAGAASHAVFFRAYVGSGLVSQCLARFQATPNRRRASQMVSALTSRGVSPWAKLTSAASASVQRLVGWPKVWGL